MVVRLPSAAMVATPEMIKPAVAAAMGAGDLPALVMVVGAGAAQPTVFQICRLFTRVQVVAHQVGLMEGAVAVHYCCLRTHSV